ncbi:hypothetical protein JYU14_00335 [Simkania negevensis]|uniref:Uncharacterized protein n=1 Tax=Simkania negevensis TaxID=83561 RepID=A0ABS3AQZ7_9BACT|nr:hypothetical protein [Simkania negevensis]
MDSVQSFTHLSSLALPLHNEAVTSTTNGSIIKARALFALSFVAHTITALFDAIIAAFVAALGYVGAFVTKNNIFLRFSKESIAFARNAAIKALASAVGIILPRKAVSLFESTEKKLPSPDSDRTNNPDPTNDPDPAGAPPPSIPTESDRTNNPDPTNDPNPTGAPLPNSNSSSSPPPPSIPTEEVLALAKEEFFQVLAEVPVGLREKQPADQRTADCTAKKNAYIAAQRAYNKEHHPAFVHALEEYEASQQALLKTYKEFNANQSNQKEAKAKLLEAFEKLKATQRIFEQENTTRLENEHPELGSVLKEKHAMIEAFENIPSQLEDLKKQKDELESRISRTRVLRFILKDFSSTEEQETLQRLESQRLELREQEDKLRQNKNQHFDLLEQFSTENIPPKALQAAESFFPGINDDLKRFKELQKEIKAKLSTLEQLYDADPQFRRPVNERGQGFKQPDRGGDKRAEAIYVALVQHTINEYPGYQMPTRVTNENVKRLMEEIYQQETEFDKKNYSIFDDLLPIANDLLTGIYTSTSLSLDEHEQQILVETLQTSTVDRFLSAALDWNPRYSLPSNYRRCYIYGMFRKCSSTTLLAD